ncbi:LysE family translocator [Actinokineospora globicatena]|uniref:Lysine transporter LysE n=1 Tax=Actinokineospora globicatena TaxID=103729 RepID=A0A9W6QRB1_9PSEU|nr:LysE family translocator [Actinokineospora globicatena]MCP2301852.1 Threonine/homoserine/homoserine lactone efflux protein [Actinokineospora globicatena]GLW76490.1 lysine transporter LysE [Actinokineospora globicatena]GLW83325.1 lysine transporter LysE [Actinokineospora globicatena]GLW94691.1 lysine transporter LysE [Actinokineospora globicatena]
MWVLVFLGAAFLVAMTPGANNLLGMHHGMRYGPARGVTALFGRLTGFALLITAVAAGLGSLLAASEVALTVVKWVGVAYLVYLGAKILLTRATTQEVVDEPVAPNLISLARKEFLVAVTNPKAVLIFTAFVPQFVEPDRGPVTVQVLVLGALYLLAELVAGSIYVGVGAVVRAVRMSGRAHRRLDQGTGVVLLGMAALLATSPR